MQLRDYQIELSNAAFNVLNDYKIAYLNMQVRTGKTITSLETAKKYGAKDVLFVTKLKAISSINEDYKHYTQYFKLTIVNFELLHKCSDLRPDLVIIDEAHSLGQFPKMSLRTQQLKDICRKLPIIFLSGTPSPESYSQLYHQFYVSSFSPFRETSFYQWAKTYVQVKEKYVYNRKLNDYSNADKSKIDKICQHLFIPFTQVEAGFKELVAETIHHVRMHEKIYKIAAKLRINKVITGKDGDVIEADTEVKLLNKLHQIYSGTVIFDNGESADGAILDDTKVKWVLKMFSGRKIAIYYKFRAEHMMIEVVAKTNGYEITSVPKLSIIVTTILFSYHNS